MSECVPFCDPDPQHANVTLPEPAVSFRGGRTVSMTSRIRFLITTAFLCHQLLAPRLVTSQLLSFGPPAQTPSARKTSSTVNEEQATIIAITQEKVGPVYKLHGKAEIHYGTYILRGDEMTYNSDTGDATVEGHALLDGGPHDEHLEASRGTYNFNTEIGRFEHATGSLGARLHGSRLLLTSSNPFFFRGKVVEQTGPDHYKVYDGLVTTCDMPRPKWEFQAAKVDVEVGGTAKIYHSTFGLEGIPVFYLPFATLPAERLPRQSGFLIPNIGQSSVKGTILGESLFWAINRSMDAHIGANYFSKRGWAPMGEFRAWPKETAFVDFNYFQVVDRGYGYPPQNQGGQEARFTAEDKFGQKYRGVADIDYLSSFTFRLAFSDVFTEAVNSEVKSDAFLSSTGGGTFYNAAMERYQDFESTTPGDVITILHAPSAELTGVDQRIGSSPLYWSYDLAIDGLSRSEPGFSTAPLVGRFDINPVLSLPLRAGGWSIRPELSLRDTAYTQQLRTSSTGVSSAVSETINRKALEGSVELRPPVLARIFDRQFLGRKWKHTIEPRVVYQYVTGIDNFPSILRFDTRDILTNSNGVEYGAVTRLFAKRTRAGPENCAKPGMPALFVGGPAPYHPIPWVRQSQPAELPCDTSSQAKEVVTWELAQKYYIDPNFGGALVPGRSNVFTSTIDLTGISFLFEPRHLSPLISRLRVQTSSRTDVEWDVDYDFKQGQINSSTALVNYRLGPFTFGGGDAFLRVPPESGFQMPTPEPQTFNQFRILLGYGHTNKPGFSAAVNIGVDAELNFVQYTAVQATYNWNCCGINLEYRRFELGTVPNENEFRFSFSLSNLGSLGNLRRSERLY
jgi:LPS-assembly protein